MPSPFSPSSKSDSSSASSLPTISSMPSQPTRSVAPSFDHRDDSASESDDDVYFDDGFDAARAAYLSRRIAEATVESAASRSQQPFDESVIDKEWEELVRSMKAIVPSQHLQHLSHSSQR